MFDKLKFLMGFEEVEDDIIEDTKSLTRDTAKKSDNFQPAYTSYKDSKIVSMQAVGGTKPSGGNNLKLILIEPKGFEECPKLVDNLKAKKPLIINLEKIDRETARKIFDFLSGATYAIDGNVQRVASNIFVFAPENVDLAAAPQDGKRNFNENNPWG